VYLRAAQAHIGLGPGQYDTAVSLLQEALRKAQQQQAPTRGEAGGVGGGGAEP